MASSRRPFGVFRRGENWAWSQNDPWTRVRLSLLALAGVTLIGTIGYTLLGLHVAQAFYMTVVTISTVGFEEIASEPSEIDTAYQVFTTVLILVGVGTALYTLSVTLETILESRLSDRFRRRRMDRQINAMSDHAVVCGYGRLGRTIAQRLAQAESGVVVIDRELDRLEDCPHPFIQGDGTDDGVLQAAGLERAATLIAATDNDSDNLYITLSARTMRPELFIIARAKLESAEPKLLQAGADRVVNPQLIGGERIAALTLQPSVAEFIDVVMHEEGLEFRLGEVDVAEDSELAGHTIRSSHVRDRTGAMVLAIREPDGGFLTNPAPESTIHGKSTMIAIGTSDQLAALAAVAGGRTARP